MKAQIDYLSKGLRLFGQPLLTQGSDSPLSCCIPTSTNTSSFLAPTLDITFIPFTNILNVEPRSNGKFNEVEITFAYILKHNQSDYPTSNNKFGVATQLMTIDSDSQEVPITNENICDLITRLAYPNIENSPSVELYRRHRILVLINPHSGKGNALKLYKDEAEPILNGGKCVLTIQETKFSGHAREIARNIDIDEFDTILCASGDGLPHEVLNGLYEREDKVRAFSKINVVQIPGGSGNAMTLSCLGTGEASEAALRMLKGQVVQCDLMAVTGWKGRSQKPLISFLSQTYGMIAQADIGTEHLRFLGGIRFDLGVAMEVLSGNKYPCDLAVKWISKKDELVNHYKKYTSGGSSNPDGEIEHFGKHPNSESYELEKLTEDSLKLKYVEDFYLSQDLMMELPTGWERWDKKKSQNNAIFYAGKMPYIASECNFFPAALPNDGAIDLVCFDGRSKLFSTAKSLLSLDKGLHIWEEDVDHVKVSAFRLVPKAPSSKKCFISVDGEDYPFVPIQVEVLSKVMRTVFWRKEFTETGFLDRN